MIHNVQEKLIPSQQLERYLIEQIVLQFLTNSPNLDLK